MIGLLAFLPPENSKINDYYEKINIYYEPNRRTVDFSGRFIYSILPKVGDFWLFCFLKIQKLMTAVLKM